MLSLSVQCNLVITCWERADLLPPLCVLFSCVFCHFPISCPRSGVVLDCIDSRSLPSFLLLLAMHSNLIRQYVTLKQRVFFSISGSCQLHVLIKEYVLVTHLTHIHCISSVHFMGRQQTMLNQIKRHRMRRLIRFSTVCLQNVLLEFE